MKEKDIKTNLEKTQSEIIFELLKSLNKGDSYYTLGGKEKDRVWYAVYQYERLVEEGVIKEFDD